MANQQYAKGTANQALNFPAEAVRQGEDNEVRVQQALARHNSRFTTFLRQQRLEYFGQVYRKVEMSMSALSDQFLLDMDERFKRMNGWWSGGAGYYRRPARFSGTGLVRGISR